MKKGYFTLRYPTPEEIPGKTFYYKRPNGSIFACGLKEAASIHTHEAYRQVGVSDGRAYLAVIYDAVATQDSELNALEEEKEMGLEEAMTREERVEVLRWYRTERKRIADEAHTALEHARDEDMRLALKKREKPTVQRGKLHADKKTNAQTINKLEGMISKMIGNL